MRKKAIFSVFLAWANQPGLVAVSWKKLLQENCNLFLPSHGREITRELLEKELDKIKLNGRKIYDKYFEIGIFERNLLQIIQGEVR